METTDKAKLLCELKMEYEALKQDRSTWEIDWRATAEHFLPNKCRFIEEESTDTNKGGLRTDAVDTTGVTSLRTLASGLHSGMTSPARPWFRLTVQNTELKKRKDVKEWLYAVEELMRTKFARSNFYQAAHTLYSEVAGFGTGVMLHHLVTEADGENLFRFDTLTIGEYCISTDQLGRGNALYRTLNLTALQIVREYGPENCSEKVQEAYKKGATRNNRFMVVQIIKPRKDRDTAKKDSANKRYASYHFEYNKGEQPAKFLRESGYDVFPVFTPRWEVLGQDVYGRSPCMDMLPECRMLQSQRRNNLTAQHMELTPPLAVPSSVKNADTMPGGVTHVDTTSGSPSIYPLFQVRSNLQAGVAAVEDSRRVIKEGLYNDLFMMINMLGTSNMTATEVAERQSEKMLMLGPVLERLHSEFLIPLIDSAFNMLVEAGELPTPPEDMQGLPVKVEFISMLAQAQKAVNTNAINRFAAFVYGNAAADPRYMDVIDVDATCDQYANDLGVPETSITSREERAASREARQQQMAQATLMEGMNKTADAAQKASQTPVRDGETNMLDATLDTMQGKQAGGQE